MNITKNQITVLRTMQAAQCQKPTVLGQLWGIKYELAVLLGLAAASFLIAPHEWERGLAVGMAMTGIASYLGMATRRARLAKALAEIGENGV